MPLGDLGHDREAEAGAGHGAGVVGAVEALEDVRQVRLGDAGALVVDGDHAVVQGDRDGAGGRAPLGGVVEQVGQGALEGGGVALDVPRVGVDLERQRRARGGGPGPPPGRGPRAARRCRSPRAWARRGPARPGRRRGWSAPRAGRGRRSSSSARASSGSEAPAWVSSSMLVRSEVSGVRSSWPASATSRRCRSREAASEASIWLNAVASRAISSSPSTRIGASRSVRAMSSAAAVSRRTGRSPLRATPQPATPAAIIPAMPNSSVTSPSLVSTLLLGLQRLGDDEGQPGYSVDRHGDHAVVDAAGAHGAQALLRIALGHPRSRARRAGSRRRRP